MIYEHTIAKFLVKNKDDMDFEKFSGRFYRNIELNNSTYQKGQYDDFLSGLYTMNQETYNEWFNALKKVTHFYARSNLDMITKFVNNNDLDAMLIAYDMFKKKCSIISRYIPKTTTTSIKENKMELYASLNMQLILIESEDENSILKKVQDEFYLYFGKYENDPRLTDIYNKTFSSLKEELINAISKEINKIGAVSENIVNRMSDSLSYDDMYHVKKLHRTPKVYQEKHR